MSKSMAARSGRGKQRYAQDGARIVAGGVVYDPETGKVLVVSSEARPDHWIVPKGGAETDETIEESAIREVWEESGAVAEIESLIGVFIDHRPPKHWSDKEDAKAPPRTAFHMYQMRLDHLEDEWPEQSTRKRTWMAWQDAHKAMLAHGRAQLAEAIENSPLAKKNE